MPKYNLIECSDNYSKTSGCLWQYYRDGPNDNTIQCESFKSKIKITGKIPVDCNTKNVKAAVPLKYLHNFCITLEMPLINCQIKLILTWSANCLISSATRKTKFAITDTKVYVPTVILLIQDNGKLLQ